MRTSRSGPTAVYTETVIARTIAPPRTTTDRCPGRALPDRLRTAVRDGVAHRMTASAVLATSPARDGSVGYRLIVNPPDLDAVRLGRLRLWQMWPATALAPAVAAGVGGALVGGAAAGLCGGAAWLIAVITVLGRSCAADRRRVRVLRVVDYGHAATGYERGRTTIVLALADTMLDADAALRAGASTVGEHVAIWRRVYDRMPTPGRPRLADAIEGIR